MIIIETKEGNIHFVNEEKYQCLSYSNELKEVWGYWESNKRDKISNVVKIAFMNQSQPTTMTFLDKQEPAPTADYENETLTALECEIDRIDSEQTKNKKEKHPNCEYIQKNGYARRFVNVCNYCDIKTVGQLLECGRREFERLRNMGRSCADIVTQALTNLYGIEKW